MASDLRASELFKYDRRVKLFLEKYQKKQPFELTPAAGGGKVTFRVQKQVIDTIKNKDTAAANKLILVSVESPKTPIKLKDLQKTAEFGGKPLSTEEDTEQAGGLQYEVAVVNSINDLIEKSGGIVTFVIAGLGTFTGITGAKQVDSNLKRQGGVKADPKADIILYKQKTEMLHPDNIYISHKKEGGPEAFQQYGGITETAGYNIYNHREVQKFLNQLVDYIGDEGLVNPVMKPIKDPVLKNLSIFGPGYTAGSSKFNLQNVHLIGQGMPSFTPVKGKKNTFTLTFDHISVNGDLSHFTQGYEPVFGATFRRGRGFKLQGESYTGVRVGIYPKALIMGRKHLVTLKA
jgi:hypothetical protein